MIGIIIDDIAEGFIISNLINKDLRTTIYITKEKDNIEILKQKKCKIIISKKLDEEMVNNYSDINFINIEELKNNGFIIESKELINAVEKGNNEEVNNIISNIKIDENIPIIINNIKLLFVKEIIESKYNNKIITIIDILNERIEKIIKEKNINLLKQENYILIN